MRLALFQPDIPQNAGALIRLGACLGVPVEVIEPCGFVFDDRRLRRAGMDYLPRAALYRHLDWEAFAAAQREAGRRILLLTTRGAQRYTEMRYRPGDVLLVGRESAGAPDAVHAAAAARLRIPMAPGLRSINVALAAAMVLGEALRQTHAFPEESR